MATLNDLYAAMLREQEAEKALIDARFERQRLRLQYDAEHARTAGPADGTESDLFVEQYKDELNADDIDFLSDKYCGGNAASSQLGVSVSTLRRTAESGSLDCVRTESGRRRFLTVDVMRLVLQRRREGRIR